MRVTFLDHSGFLVESDSAALLFDWWKGELPAVRPGVPLYIFASHAHPDHFDPRIFALDDGDRDVCFVLGHDVKLTPRNCSRWGLSPSTAEKCRNLRGGQSLTLPGAAVEALPSTDEGEAFLVTVDGQTVFHAGDLNWWHWEGEDKAWNNNMAANYKREVDRLSGQYFDAAFVPLDPRLSDACSLGLRYFLEQTDAEHVFPMHFWGDYEVCRRIRKEKDLQGMLEHVHPVEYQGQEWELC